MQLKKHFLDEYAQDYIEDALSMGNLLAHQLLGQIGTPTRIYTCLPLKTNKEKLRDFQHGGIAPKTETMADLAEKIESFLSSEDSYFITETMFGPKDTYLDKCPSKFFIHNEAVYFYALGKNRTRASILEILRHSREFPFIGIYGESTSSRELSNNKSIGNETLKDLVMGTNIMIIGAYDEEAYIFIEMS